MKWVWSTIGLAALVAITIPLINYGDGNYHVVVLDCDSTAVFSQEYVDSLNFADEGNYFWAGARAIPGDYNLDGKLSPPDIIYLVKHIYKADSTQFYPDSPDVVIFYKEENGRKLIKFIEKRP